MIWDPLSIWVSHKDSPGVEVGVGVGTPIFDEECRHVAEPHGLTVFAWWPRTCRNGKRRWLTWLEHHADGTYTFARSRK